MSRKQLATLVFCGLAPMMAVAIVGIGSDASGVQLLSRQQLSSYVGLDCSLCKGELGTGKDCQECHPSGVGNDHWDFDGGGVSRGCLDGSPDGCSEQKDGFGCGTGYQYFYHNDECDAKPYDSQYWAYPGYSVSTGVGPLCDQYQ